MNRRSLFAFMCASAALLSGCYLGAPLIPIQGPSPKPSPLMDPRGAFKSGRFYVDLDNTTKPILHEECVGRWEPPTAPNAAGADTLASAWDVVYGAGYYEKSVLSAKKCARGSGTSKHGTKLEAEMCQFEMESKGKMRLIGRGVAKDNNNNFYRID